MGRLEFLHLYPLKTKTNDVHPECAPSWMCSYMMDKIQKTEKAKTRVFLCTQTNKTINAPIIETVLSTSFIS